jgi:hypothetical protein
MDPDGPLVAGVVIRMMEQNDERHWEPWINLMRSEKDRHRLTEISKTRRPLELLAQYGRTKRIRRTAAKRLATK